MWSPGIDSKEWIPPAYVAWRVAVRYDNPIPTRCLAAIDYLKILAQFLMCSWKKINAWRETIRGMSTKRWSSLLEFGSCDPPARRITIGSIATLHFLFIRKICLDFPQNYPYKNNIKNKLSKMSLLQNILFVGHSINTVKKHWTCISMLRFNRKRLKFWESIYCNLRLSMFKKISNTI